MSVQEKAKEIFGKLDLYQKFVFHDRLKNNPGPLTFDGTEETRLIGEDNKPTELGQALFALVRDFHKK